MVYLSSFHIPTQAEEEFFFTPPPLNPHYKNKNYRTCYTTKYPFGLFVYRRVPDLEFSDITIFCGNNGCGKSSLLNVMAEALKLSRESVYNRSDFFDDYVELCRYETERPIPSESRVITSDDVFDRVLDIRHLNQGIDRRREDLLAEFVGNRQAHTDGQLNGLDDYDRWKRVRDARRQTSSQYLRSNLMRNVQERSNGESALSFFVDAIQGHALYLLDEPENSLSPANQLQLKYFLEDSVRSLRCQFILSTHSPLLLSLRGARIYDLDSTPVCTRRWTELECVRVYRDFFEETREAFE